jgi:subtilisin family serine protease
VGTVAVLLLTLEAIGGDDSPSVPSSPKRLVVATFDERGVPEGLGGVVADMLQCTINSPEFQLVERRQVRRVLEEQAFASSDLTQPGDAVRYGRLADAHFALIGSVSRIDGVYILSARLVDVVTAVIPERWRAVVQFRTVDEMAARITDLARRLGLRVESEASAATPSSTETPQASVEAQTTPSTIRDVLEQVGDVARAEVRVTLEGPEGREGLIAAGVELQIRVESDREGYLSLFVVDANGRVGVLVPHHRVPQVAIEPMHALTIPKDVGFRLLAGPPFGLTRIKAIVTKAPMSLDGVARASEVLRRVTLDESLRGADLSTRTDWATAELEFVVVPDGSVQSSATRTTVAEPIAQGLVPVVDARLALRAALESLGDPDGGLSSQSCALLRWPLDSAFQPPCDIAWRGKTSNWADCGIRVGVIDADFDPDDPFLEASFAGIQPSLREELRAEMRRNERPPFRHGNRVASIIGGDAPWLPSVLPGVPILPVRVTTQVDAPVYRAPRGGPEELLNALQRACDAGCRVINLSLAVQLDGEALEAFASHPVWDQLERARVVLVCAAGNGNENLDKHPLFPACLDRPNILCVGAAGPDGRPSQWETQRSAYGARSVDLFAPGTWVAVSDGGGIADLANGSSYACAFAAGAAARLLWAEPELTGEEVVTRLVGDGRPLPGLTGLSRGGLLTWPDRAP